MLSATSSTRQSAHASAYGTWTKIEGSLVGEATTLDVPNKSGIYMWKLETLPQDYLNMSTEDFVEHIDSRCNSPIGKTGLNRNGRVLTLGQELRGSKLPRNKKDFLIQILNSPEGPRIKRILIDFLSSLDGHSPALYVGEAKHLFDRMVKHLSGRTDFGEMVEQSSELSFSKLAFWYYLLKDDDTDEKTALKSLKLRETMEYVSTMCSVAGHTQRAG